MEAKKMSLCLITNQQRIDSDLGPCICRDRDLIGLDPQADALFSVILVAVVGWLIKQRVNNRRGR